jgi:hypothetical protein
VIRQRHRTAVSKRFCVARTRVKRLTKQERIRPATMPYAAPKRIEMYMDPGSENICTLHKLVVTPAKYCSQRTRGKRPLRRRATGVGILACTFGTAH